ncbi:MAG: hypothetical protein MI924_13620 [Chloroflexales bacterium]|nr:hypothetical protein [Chloroflexales bacterium]
MNGLSCVRRLAVPLISIDITGLFVALPAHAVVIKLSGMQDFGNVASFAVSADGQRVVYLADQDVKDMVELYSASITGGSPIKLNGPLPDGAKDVDAFQISPDGHRVVYLADQELKDVPELYSVPITGGSPTKLNSPLGPGQKVCAFKNSADSAQVVYLSDQSAKDEMKVYSVAINDVATNVEVSNLIAESEDLAEAFAITPNSRQVIYLAAEGEGPVELFGVPIDGLAKGVKLNGPLGSDEEVSFFCISSDGSRAVYLVGNIVAGLVTLYSAPVTGGALSVKLGENIAAGESMAEAFAISSDAWRVVYLAEGDAVELFSVPVDGSAQSVKLNGALAEGGNVIESFTVSPDSRHQAACAVIINEFTAQAFLDTYCGGAIPRGLTAGIAVGEYANLRANNIITLQSGEHDQGDGDTRVKENATLSAEDNIVIEAGLHGQSEIKERNMLTAGNTMNVKSAASVQTSVKGAGTMLVSDSVVYRNWPTGRGCRSIRCADLISYARYLS